MVYTFFLTAIIIGLFIVATTKVSLSRHNLLILVVTLTLLVIFVVITGSAVNIILASILVFFWQFALTIDRIFIYLYALLFLICTPLLLILNLDKLAEWSTILCYLMLLIGVFKDMFYEKIFKN